MKQNKKDIAMAVVDLMGKIAKAVIEFIDSIEKNQE